MPDVTLSTDVFVPIGGAAATAWAVLRWLFVPRLERTIDERIDKKLAPVTKSIGECVSSIDKLTEAVGEQNTAIGRVAGSVEVLVRQSAP